MTEKREVFNRPQYDRYLKIRTEKTVVVQPRPVIIVEGALALCDPKIIELSDISVWIDTDDDVRLSRRVLKNEQRPSNEKVPLSDLLKIYRDKTKPAFEKFIEPTKKYANVILPNYGFTTEKPNTEKINIQGVDILLPYIAGLVKKRRND